MGEAGCAFAEANRGATERTLAAISNLMRKNTSAPQPETLEQAPEPYGQVLQKIRAKRRRPAPTRNPWQRRYRPARSFTPRGKKAIQSAP